MDILDDMGVSKLSAKVCFFKVNYSFNTIMLIITNISQLRLGFGLVTSCNYA